MHIIFSLSINSFYRIYSLYRIIGMNRLSLILILFVPVFLRQVQRGRGRSWRRIYSSWRRRGRGIRAWGTSLPIWRSWGSSGWGDDGREAGSPRWTSWGGKRAIIFGRGRTRWHVTKSWRCTGWSSLRRTERGSRGIDAKGRGGGSFSGNDEWYNTLDI